MTPTGRFWVTPKVGISRDELEWVVPVALCREFLRGGKPQLFFVASTRLPADDLPRKRRKAIQEQIKNGRQEVLDEALIVTDVDQLESELAQNLTGDCYMNMYYARKGAQIAHRAGVLRPRAKR